MFARGHGVISNAPDAVSWFRRAAEQGHAASQFELSLAYARGHPRERLPAFRNWYRYAADYDSDSAEQAVIVTFSKWSGGGEGSSRGISLEPGCR